MKTYKQFLVILSEASDKKKQFLAQKYPKVSKEHIDHWESKVPDKYLETAVRFQHNGSILPEDYPRVQKVLTDHETIRHPEYQKDLNRYKHLSDIEDAHDKYLGRAVNTAKAESLLNHPGATLLHNSNGYTVHRINTEQAAKNFGKGTKWCTGADDNNMFHRYSNNLMVIHTPNGEKYQIHHDSQQLMDIKDKSVDPSQLVQKHPELKNVKALAEPTETGQHFYKTTEDYHEALSTVNTKSPLSHRLNAASYIKHSEKFIKDPDADVRLEVAKNPNHAGKLVDDHNEFVRQQVASHPEHAGKLINDPNTYVRMQLARHPEHAHHFINDPDDDVRAEVANHSEHAHHFINDPNTYVRYGVAQHPEHAGKLLNDRSMLIRMKVAVHKEHAGKLINDPESRVRQEVAKHPEYAEKLANDPNIIVKNESFRTLRGY